MVEGDRTREQVGRRLGPLCGVGSVECLYIAGYAIRSVLVRGVSFAWFLRKVPEEIRP